MKGLPSKFSTWDSLSARLKAGVLYWLLTLLTLIIYVQNLPPLQRLEYRFEDRIRSSRPIKADRDNIAIVGIDAKSINEVGKWPWDHGKISDLLITICDYKPKAVLLELPFAEQVEEFVSGNSGQLAQSMEDCGNVVLPFDIVVGEEGESSRPAPAYINFSSHLPGAGMAVDPLPRVVAAFVPPDIFAKKVATIGFRYFETDLDDKVRSANMLINYDDRIYLSSPLQFASIYFGKNPNELSFSAGTPLLVNQKLPLDARGRMLVDLPVGDNPYPIYSAIDILTGDADKSTVAGKAVIVASTNPGDFDYVTTSTAGRVPTYTFSAAIAQNLISGKIPTRFDFPVPIDLLLILGIGVFGGLVLPKMPLMYRLVALFILGFILVNINFVLFSGLNIMISVLYPIFTVVSFFVASLLIKQSGDSLVGSLSKGLDLKKLLGGEPIAVQRDGGREIKFDDIPARLFSDEKPAPELLQETIRLDFEALQKGGDLIPQSEIEKFERRTGKIAVPDAATGPVTYEATEEKTGQFIPDLLGVDMSGIAKPHEPEPAEKTPSSSSKSSVSDDEIILTPEERKLYGVKFTSEGQPVSFGRYLVLEPLGMGAMGTVYKGKDPAIDRLVALKTIRLESIANENEIGELKERLSREAKAAGNLSHPNIVTIYDFGLQGNLQYIAMEYLEGYTLEAVLRRNLQLNYRIIASVMMQVCSALEYAHKMGIIHRDIKPANIMVTDGFRVKVMDFGIAHFKSSSMTQTGVAMGTPNYISPEQLRGKEVTPSSDIFSLGVVLYELLTHKRPFVGENISALVYKIVNEEPPMPSTIDPKIPPLFDLILKRSLAKDPADRYRSAKEMAAALEDFTAALTKKPAMA